MVRITSVTKKPPSCDNCKHCLNDDIGQECNHHDMRIVGNLAWQCEQYAYSKKSEIQAKLKARHAAVNKGKSCLDCLCCGEKGPKYIWCHRCNQYHELANPCF